MNYIKNNLPKVLITGADGFIGSHLVEALVRRGYPVRAFVFYNSLGSLGWLENCAKDVKGNFEIYAGDIRDPNGVRQALSGCQAVLHLAALIAIPFSYQSPDSYIDTNIKGTLNVLQAARDLGVSKLVQTSTSEVYGSAKFVPITEEHPILGQSPYSASKIGADQLAYSFYSSFDTPVVLLRPFNTYGPRQSARAVVPTIISQIASGMRHIKLGSLEPTRDFNFVQDTVNGFVAALESAGGLGEVINIGGSCEVSIGDLVKLISDLMGAQIDIGEDVQRIRPAKSEVDRLWASNEKAKKLISWQPEYAGFEGLKKGLSETINWFSDPRNLSMYKADIYNV